MVQTNQLLTPPVSDFFRITFFCKKNSQKIGRYHFQKGESAPKKQHLMIFRPSGYSDTDPEPSFFLIPLKQHSEICFSIALI